MGEVVVCDSKGALHSRRENPTPVKREILEASNPQDRRGSLRDRMADADVFIGVSRGGLIDEDDIRRMAPEPIVLARA